MDLLGTRRARREFEAFVADAAAPLFRSGYLMTADATETEDLLQETFLRVARRWTRVRTMEHPLAYTRRILVNLVLDGAKARGQRGEELGHSHEDLELVDHRSLRVLSGIDDRLEFSWALATLPPRQRAVLVLRYWDDLPESEVAELLDCPVGTVKSSGARGVAELRRILGKTTDIAASRTRARDQEERLC